jgi:predicted RND superfamily exporter protein
MPGLAPRIMERLARLVLGHRLLFGVGTLLLTAGAVYLASGIRADFDAKGLFSSGDTEIAFLEQFQQRFEPDDNVLLLLVEADDVFRPQVLRFIDKLTRQARAKTSFFRRVESLTTVSDLRGSDEGTIDTRPLFETIPSEATPLVALKRRALQSPLLGGRIVARDGTLTLLALSLRRELREARHAQRAFSEVQQLLAAAGTPRGVRVSFTGMPYVSAEVVRMLKSDQLFFLPLGCAITVLMLTLLYRSFWELHVPMLAVGLSALYTVALMVALDTPIDIVNNVLPLLVLIYGVADAVHLLGRIHEQMRAGQARDLAIRTAVRHLGIACLLTSGTTAIGFASLVTGSLSILRTFGLFAAAGVMIAYLTTVVLVPLGVSLRRRHPATRGAHTLKWLDRLLARVAGLTVRRPRLVLALSAVVGISAVALGSQVEVDRHLLGAFREGHPIIAATRLAERKLEGIAQLELSLVGRPGQMKDPAVLEAMQRLQERLEQRRTITSTLSLATYVRELHKAVVGKLRIPDSRRGVASLLLMAEGEERLGRMVDFPYASSRIHIGCRDIGARQTLALADQVTRQAQEVFAPLGIRTRVTGTQLVGYRGTNRLVRDLALSLTVAFLVIAVVLAITFRSVRAGLVSLIPNVTPLAVGLGFMTLSGIRLQPGTVICFSIALGIAVDDTIHFFSRYREELTRGAAPDDAIRTTMTTAGRAMVFTSVVLICGLMVSLGSNFNSTAAFGRVAIVILASALLTDLLVTPACLLVFKPWIEQRGGEAAEAIQPTCPPPLGASTVRTSEQ